MARPISKNELFSDIIGKCYIKMMLDVRNQKRVESNDKGNRKFPLCIRFVMGDRYYFRLGEEYSEDEVARIMASTGQGEEKKNGVERDFDRKKRLRAKFDFYVSTVSQLNESGILTLDRIKTALTGRSENCSFVSVWQDIINEKRNKGKAGTADSYQCSLNSFMQHTGLTEADGFAVDEGTINKWVEGLNRTLVNSTTQGIYLRACRVAVNRCIADGHMMPKNYMFGKKREKIAIPVGLSRKSMFLSVEQMAELYDHWKQRDLTLPIFNSRSKDAQPSSVKTEQQREMVYQSLALFLMQYLCCGCNLIDLALLEYNSFYFDNHQKAFRFIRRKTANETSDGDGMEVIVPIIDPMRVIIDSLGAKPKLGSRVFPFLLGDIESFDGEAIRKRIHQCNKDIAERMAKVAADIGWTVKPTGTYARHSFATNLHSAKLPMPYISDAMGHSLGNRGQITMRYISPYTIDERIKYNNVLMGLADSPEQPSSKKEKLLEQLSKYSAEDLKYALLMLRERELDNL